MHRFFVEPSQIRGGRAVITGSDVSHISRVLRLGPGDAITLLDGCGGVFHAVIEKAGRSEVTCAVKERLETAGGLPLKVTLVQGIPKGDKMDLIIQKGTELGVSRFIPLACERSVVRLDDQARAARRRERWQRVAVEAAKQCRRPYIPEVARPAGWQEILSDMPSCALALIPWEGEENVTLRDMMRENDLPAEVYIFIGPEGGFAASEVALARAENVLPVSLGPRILRADTAALIVPAIVLYYWGDLGGARNGR